MKEILQKTKEFQKQVKAQTGIALAAAFAFVIAFSWNEFLKEAVISLVGLFGVQNALLLRFLAAIAATIIGVLGIMYFARKSQ